MALNGPQKTVVQLVSVVVVMGGLAWASVPFYDWFCRVTGFGGATGVAEAGSDTILDKTIKVRFDASKERGMPWEFRPVQTEMELRIGETGLAFYEAYNPTDRPVAGQASYNVAPYSAGGYFDKIACFCFEEQVLQPGERVQMPVTFFVDPEIVNDRDAKYVHTITLSYTFYEIDLPEGYAALDAGEKTNTN
ncbi:cytochrome c oxidase assembly protein [Ruegeria pomeroyi]|jgi:cytochrome c oxidase assembly protein subunit 11|uniref:Cytochrome c oxidase assembly protein CtaG n=2 Tax=Ruegeria pomeroyi TaxID=89184 RepID=COXZ_RUEPO|nr:cytochrome c oxidase assembly protein [Ruegeria pomeroyi]Q5LNX9.1 RecName: Full=Cytochrome c oxidase assembly protein CtaG [Ruegeria pomeroyi DSS-3]HCE72630.1 cytochrome c oxidase assembly protein [Ruegeria sp.]AAV96309.1 cytochrome c oxidase assembly protein CtaG [Ruegeria pomeroyi DSS-3]NVK96661.1 cytochrome c oxidase assembly protein [Ruegeria pomeroyi]NVL02075.1 cytochrome c oxidase assembly protein [Ruegeria pomeroyi]QWV09857.1 cytochrome c oxidase assembly protein [Ruegeria pomeroyi]